MNGLSVRTTAYDDPDHRNLKAFYALKPMINPLSNLYGSGKVPDSFLMQMDGIVHGAVQSAFDDAKPLKEALAEAQTQLQAALLQAQQEQQNSSPEPTSNAKVSSGVAVEQAVTITK